MPNTREKLIELVTAALCNQSAEEVADHLIANGVTVRGEIDAKIYQLMRECERLKEEKERLANAVNVLEEINSDFYKKLRSVTVQEWIPVTERLPEDNERVLICSQLSNQYVAQHYRGKFYVDGTHVASTH